MKKVINWLNAIHTGWYIAGIIFFLLITGFRYLEPLTKMNNRITVLERKAIADSIEKVGMRNDIQRLIIGQGEENGKLDVLIAREHR